MPHWSIEEEHNLIDMVEEGRSIKDMCKILYRSPEARKLKMRRLGLEPSVSREKAGDKVTSEATQNTLKQRIFCT